MGLCERELCLGGVRIEVHNRFQILVWNPSILKINAKDVNIWKYQKQPHLKFNFTFICFIIKCKNQKRNKQTKLG